MKVYCLTLFPSGRLSGVPYAVEECETAARSPNGVLPCLEVLDADKARLPLVNPKPYVACS